MSDELRSQLEKLGKILGPQKLPPGTKVETMTPQEFIDQAVMAVAKAEELEKAGSTEEATGVLDLLRENVADVQKAMSFESTGSVSVKVQNDKTTSDKDKSSKDNAAQTTTEQAAPNNYSPNGIQKGEEEKKEEVEKADDCAWPLDINAERVEKADDDSFGADPWKSIVV